MKLLRIDICVTLALCLSGGAAQNSAERSLPARTLPTPTTVSPELQEAIAPPWRGMASSAKLTDDQNNDIGFWENSYNQNRNTTVDQCQLRDVLGATNLNLTLALHKSRFVEFTAKPEKAPASDAAQ